VPSGGQIQISSLDIFCTVRSLYAKALHADTFIGMTREQNTFVAVI